MVNMKEVKRDRQVKGNCNGDDRELDGDGQVDEDVEGPGILGEYETIRGVGLAQEAAFRGVIEAAEMETFGQLRNFPTMRHPMSFQQRLGEHSEMETSTWFKTTGITLGERLSPKQELDIEQLLFT
ncbi:hypothetical protein L873DRAFT_582285 [Choiromyces venosus 120613-1]|uniref:Uncharacterized protein n=1 Tax=Choiromyces venosus 120613-1 TaxID=1336337 RepID=A0A3N4IYI8_9PEZI|nr:hypothetical protein L873DRAFT_582285 [Choiromyces venosus 120613-1]